MEKKTLSKFEKEIENAIFGSKILRNQMGIEILGPQNWKQDYKVFYRNVSNRSLKYVRLSPRVKKVQRNLSVYDSRRNRLSIIPSYLEEKALCKICGYYTLKATEIMDQEEDTILRELVDNPLDFSLAFCHDNEEGNNSEKNDQINSIDIYQKIKGIASALEKAEKSDRNSYFYINRILTLVRIYKWFYLPIVELEIPAKQEECFFLSYSVENLREESIVRRSLLLLGFQSLYFPLEIEESASNHLMILSPEGTSFSRAGVSGLEGTGIENKYRDLSKSLDDDMVYFHIPPKDADVIHRRSFQLAPDGRTGNTQDTSRDESVSRENEGPTIEMSIGISRDFPRRLSLIRILTILMYLAIFIPTYSLIIFSSQVSSSLIMETLILEVTILISLGVYAMDKTFLHEYIAAQIVILFVLFVVEIAILSIFC